MKLKPWYTVVHPREDLKANRAIDASEFAVHLDEVYLGRGADEYRRPEQFFARTFLTDSLLDFAAEVVRRLSGVAVATSANFSMTTQFGGGKTHALTLLYHLAENGPRAESWQGVDRIMQRAGVATLPKAKVAVFVGQRFDPRGGEDGTPLRRTPWGELAWLLAGEAGYRVMAPFDEQGHAPGGDTIAKVLDLVNGPALILMDELINYASRYRASGLGAQLYNFLQNLSEEARTRTNVVCAVSLPASQGEMNAEDVEDYKRISHLLDRLSKSVIMSVETDAAEIIRRRLFDWGADDFGADGRIRLNQEATATCNAYVQWLEEHRGLLPTWFSLDTARLQFSATYPFHPALISVFERKWQSLPSFQRTRGVLRMLALWVANAYQEGFVRGRGHGDPLISMGSAPFDNPIFRQDVFAQLGERNLEIPVTTDIFGNTNANAARLDHEAASAAIKQAQLHRKVATAIFFESNGGVSHNKAQASLPEIRLAVGQPDLDIGNIEAVLEALAPPDGICYYLDTAQNRYWFSMRPNLTRLLASRKEQIKHDDLRETIRAEIIKEVGRFNGNSAIFFPERTNDIPNQPVLTLVVLPPEQGLQQRPDTEAIIEQYTLNYGSSARGYKNALIWAIADNDAALLDAARKMLAWQEIADNEDELQLSEAQRSQLPANLRRARGELKETVWRTYSKVYVLGKEAKLRTIDLGRHNSDSAENLFHLIVRELRRYDDISNEISPTFLVRYWPPALPEWSTRAVRDAFFAAPEFPRITSDKVVKAAIASGVSNGILAYISKLPDGSYVQFAYKTPAQPDDIAISEDMYIIPGEAAEAYLAALAAAEAARQAEREAGAKKLSNGHGSYTGEEGGDAGETDRPTTAGGDAETATSAGDGEQPADTGGDDPPAAGKQTRIVWEGDLPHQKWMNFYMKALTRFTSDHTVTLHLRVEIVNGDGISAQKIAEMQVALRELGLEETTKTA